MKNNPKLSIIIPIFNSGRQVLDCLESIFKSNYSDYEVIVIDNNSRDNSSELIEEKFPQVKLIRNEKNLGFTGGTNAGIKESKGELIFLLNDDTIIDPNLLDILIEELESSPQVGIVGPKIYFAGESNKIWFAGGKINWLKGETFHLNKRESKLEDDTKKEVDFITGCALMIKREVVDKIGLLDKKFFAYYEDADWAQKAKKAGYSVIYVPFGGVWHIKSATASTVYFEDIKGKYFRMLGRYLKFSILLKWKNYRNRFVFFMRHAKFIYKITFLIKFIFVLTPKFLWLITGQVVISLIKIAKKHL